ncbi:hypothetical protein [Pararhizobium sp.]|uniref:hypothetical protein n=1 Tax=Pararhizobium sp. TaxID=1977563 RepID=UPI00271B9EA3|nr:hypothetical protein [Pararhizobium sp.]MDO9417413.1 hypothetical protein [Pararhizobium sp.]MDP2248398.1 hypothetical protein [Nitrosomonadales bacterium]
MFQTFDHARISLPISNPDESVWAYAELMINAPWFVADCQITEDEISIRTSYILSNPLQLNELRANQNVAIKGLYVVSPPHINSTESWKMDQVAQVSTGVASEEDYKMKIDIYELCNGNKYYSSDISVTEENIEDIKVIFSV